MRNIASPYRIPTMKYDHFFYSIAFVVLAACTTPNPRPRPDAGPMQCQSSIDCSAPTAICDTTVGQCVQCTVTEHSACTGETPLCSVEDTCQACSAHSQCSSNVCLPDGSCSVENSADVAYVTAGAPSTNFNCTKTDPCSTITAGLATKRPYIKVSGTLYEQVSFSDQTVTILAEPGAVLSGATTTAGSIITVAGNSKLTVYDLEISGAKSTADGDGILMPGGSTVNLSLNRVKVLNNSRRGIYALGGAISISQSTISNNQVDGIATGATMVGGDYTALKVSQSTLSYNKFAGIAASGGSINISDSTINNNASGGGPYAAIYANSGSITISRSTITSNPAGGIASFGAAVNISQSTISYNQAGGIIMNATIPFDIRNNFIVQNGNNSSDVGGINVNPQQGSKLEFNTIVDNKAMVAGAGVYCSISYSIPNNLIFSNASGQISSACTARNSVLVDPGAIFKSPPSDYHLSAAAPIRTIRDAVDCPGTAMDVDGDARPSGAKCDLGADEYR